jgi:vacuolar-type H+-ATPase subunit I/STV1
MPVIDGQVRRSRFTSLKLRELSSVDNPAQIGARMAIMKRAPVDRSIDESVLKYICENDGAHSFQEVLADSKFDQNVWPCVDALSQSIRSIVGDKSLTGGEREAKISASVTDFLTAVRDISPEVSKQLAELVRKREGQMPKTVEELEKQVGELTGQLTSANALIATEKARADTAEKAKADAMSEKDKMKAECDTAKAALTAATDETIKYGGEEIKKSEVGDGPFKIAKGATIEAQKQRLEKLAGEKYQHVVGTATEKALVLKTIDQLAEDDPTRKALEAVLTSAEKMAAAGFDRLGGQGGDNPTQKAAQSTFDSKIGDIQKRDNCTRTQAMSKARSEFPAEYSAAYPDSAPAVQAVAN